MKQTVPTHIRIRLGIAAVTIGAAFLLSRTPLVHRFENSAYDLRARLLAQTTPPSPEIVLVGIDEDSLSRLEKRLGRWPWPRSVIGSVVDYCSEARVVILDILFAEGHLGYGESDDLFVDQVHKHGRVVTAIHFNRERNGNVPGELLQRFMLPPELVRGLPAVRRHDFVTAPFANLLRVSAGVGHVNYQPNLDGVVRGYEVFGQVGEEIYPSLALAGLLAYRGLDPGHLARRDDGRLELGASRMPLSEAGSFLMSQPARSYTGYSIADVLGSWNQENRGGSSNIPRSVFKDKIVIIGSVAAGLLDDRRVTPLDPKTPGMLIHAAALDNLLTGRHIAIHGPAIHLSLLVLMGLIPTFSQFKKPLFMFSLSLATLSVFILASLVALYGWHYMVPMIGPMLCMVLTSGLLGTLYWYAERDQRRYLEALEEAKQEFTDMLVHDMKNSLVPVIMSLEMANEAVVPLRPSQLHEFITTVDSSSRRLLSQINDLLDIRKMVEGKLRLDPRLIEPGKLVQQVVAAYMNTARFSGQRLVYLPGAAAEHDALLDPHILERVMENLIWNAIKYGRENKTVEVSCWMAEDRYHIAVANHGVPIPEEKQPYMFASFITGDLHQTKQRVPSTGLGLAFCKLAVEAQGGTIKLESPWPGHADGARFTLTFPA